MSRQLLLSDNAVSDVDLRVRRLEARVAQLEQHIARLSAALDRVHVDPTRPDPAPSAGSAPSGNVLPVATPAGAGS